MGLVPWARSAAAPCSGSGPTSTQLRKLSRPAISPGEVGGPGAQAEVGMALVHLWAWGAARLPLGAVSPLRDRAPRSARRAAHSPPLPGLPALAVSTPPGLVYGCPWVWLGLSGREQPPPDALTGPSPPASRLQSRARPSVLASKRVSPRGAVQGGHGRQAGRFCALSTARGGRAECLLYRSSRLWVCTQPLPGLRDVAEWVPGPRGPGGGPARSALAGSVSFRWRGWAPLHGRGACALRRDLVGLAHRSAVQQPSHPVRWGRLWESVEVTAEQLTWFAGLMCLRVVCVAPLFSPQGLGLG